MATEARDPAAKARQVRMRLFHAIDPFNSQLTPEHQQLIVLGKTFPLWSFETRRTGEGEITWTAALRHTPPLTDKDAGVLESVAADSSFGLADLLADQMAIIERLHGAGYKPA